ncbi:ABC transporter substrate-binding protein [Nonomuraea sp. NEAU-A123]|uniref:ABC transporter substrate-binding protein n=1 Tax=Nonomuraea sp. NEAU-A123 TaxID=2839649 RepID=UPI001BE3D97C|nr:ABC transporter substrate-binding protein [Nonomuraea sp. NEAU-A123]MBT2225687.1 ABC transporter substrate-binding protein [Nonomuraea sp. NEAU-A123]
MTWLGEQLGRIADDMPERDLGARAIEVHQRRRRNFLALTAAVVVVITVLAATVGVRALPAEPRAAARPPSPPEQSTITVGVMPTVESAPVFVALNKGYFKEEGLTVQPLIISGPAAVVPQVLSGIVDLAQTDYFTVFRVNEAGEKFKIVSSLYQAAPGSFAIVVNAKSKIRTATDLKRKTVAVPNLMGLDLLALTAVLKRAGLTLRDVVLVEKSYPDMLYAMGKGQVDAALLAEPFITMGRETRHTRIVADVMTQEFANLYTAGISATDKWISGHPRTLAAFQRALAKAQRLIASDPQQVRDLLPTYTRISRAAAAGIALGSYPAQLDLTELQRVADLARAYKFLKHPADVRNAVVKGG